MTTGERYPWPYPLNVQSILPRISIGQCLCGHFEWCDSCTPKNLLRPAMQPGPSEGTIEAWKLWQRAQQMDVEKHPCVTLGDE